jgi:hypothetical protein
MLGVLLFLAAVPVTAQVDGTIALNNARQQGTNPSGRIMVNSTDPVQPGSSISHWDPSAFPNLLMEPAINGDLPFLGLDVSAELMYDIGWTVGNSNVTIFPLNPPGEGFTDPRPFAGAPGNPATTLGEARVNLFNAVLGTWGTALNSTVNIEVLVQWVPQFCQGGAATLASAGALFAFFDDPGGAFPFGDTWYHGALAEALTGSDLSGPPAEGGGDIIVFMNSEIDEECLGAGTGYYYGLDGNNPGNQIDVSPVVLHEIGHGLGFSNFTNETTGAFFQGMPNVYDQFTLDETTGQTWAEMGSDAERTTSSVNVRQVTWNGALANAAADALLDVGVPELTINAPAEIAGTYEIGAAAFGGAIPGGGLSGEIACMTDGIDPFVTGDLSNLNGCLPATNPGAIAGKIALIDRGACPFTTKAKNAQDAGAIGVIIANIAGNTAPGLGGTDDSVVIPTVSVGRSDGTRLRKAACGNAAAIVQDDRFQVQVQFSTGDGQEGFGVAHQLTDDGAYFTFFDPENPEIFVKVIDGCDFNNHYWLFAAGLTNVQVIMTVIDTQTGALQAFLSPLGSAFAPIQNTMAFTCP